MLLTVAPLGLTFWFLLVAGGATLVLFGIVALRHLEMAQRNRVRQRLRRELEPVFSRFLETKDPAHLAEALRPAFLRMDAAERPVAALLVIEVMQEAPRSQREHYRDALEQAGIVELGERGTRRRAPWRRALACEALGKMGAKRSVPVLLERLDDRRPEVRIAAVRALGEMRADEAVPALTDAFLDRSRAPTNIVHHALRRIGGEAGPAFERGIDSDDPIVRISSAYGLAGIAEQHGAAVFRLAEVLGSDADSGVRAAAAASLGLVGGGKAPDALVAATTDPDLNVRRSAVRALGSFDDPNTGGTLVGCTEDDDRETAIRAAEALLALARRPRARREASALVESSSAWAIQYARTVEEVSA